MNNIESFIKFKRKQAKLTQQQLADKAGVGLRFIRDIERGKDTIQLNKANQVLQLFGFSLHAKRQKLDAYQLYFNFLMKHVNIRMSDRTIKQGILVKEVLTNGEITAWQFLPNKYIDLHFKRELCETILHETIIKIELSA